MSEQEILQAIMQDMKTGWWEADLTRCTLRLSDVLQVYLGLSKPEISFEELRQLVLPSFLNQTMSDMDIFLERFPRERAIPLNGPQGVVWFTWKVLRKTTTEDGRVLAWGYMRETEAPEQPAESIAGIQHIEDLLGRINNISYSLLSLLHTDRVDDAVNKILGDILNMFHGSRAYIVEFDWQNHCHRCSYEVTVKGVSEEQELLNTLSMDDTPWWTEQISAGNPVILSDLDELPPQAWRERDILAGQDIRSLIVMPLVSRDKVRGYVGIDLVRFRHDWTSQDCQWFSSLVNIIGLCLELQRSEQEALHERSYLEALYRHMPMGYIRMKMLYDEQGQVCDYEVLDSNYAADKMIGMPRDHYVGQRARAVGSGSPEQLIPLQQVLNSGQYIEIDSFLRTSSRNVHCILYTISKDEVICLFSDTTEVHRAHEALHRNEKLLRNIFDNVQVGIELYDNNGVLVDINNKDMEIFGVQQKKDAIGLNFYENPNVPLEIRENVRRGCDQAFRLTYPFDKVKSSYYDSSKTGDIEIYTTVNMLYDIHGNRENFVLLNIDNTEINRAHNRLAEFESSFSLVSHFGKIGYCRYDLVSEEGYAVPQWYLNLGEDPATPLSEIIGTYRNLDQEDAQLGQESLEQLLRGEIDSFVLDLKVLPKGGGELWTRSNVMRNPLNNDPSKVEVVSVNYDITELKRTEKSLIEAKNKAEVSDRLKSAFLANMSHEIRTPLNAIVGFSNLLAETEELEERREYMNIVQENNELLLKLISDILDLSKIEAGTFDFNYGALDVNLMCEEIVRALELKVQGRPVKLVFGEHQEQCCIFGDKSRLTQVITNFINNAVKFTHEGQITLSYQIDGDDIYFYVEDTGNGIPEEQLNTIFDRFVKLNSFAQGTGLGLSICKSIVEQMKGRIGVDSEVDCGSRFWFSVPIAAGDDEFDPANGELALPNVVEPLAMDDNTRPTVLVAEDTDSNFLLISLILCKEYQVIRAANGEEAVRLFSEQKPAAILMDLKMPVMDGVEAIRQIRQIDPAVPIIAVTTFDSERDRRRSFEAGCNEYMAKPLSGDKLRQKLHNFLYRN